MRFIRIYKVFMKQYLKTLMEYRSDFLIGMMSFLINQIANLVFITLVFMKIPSLNGWNFEEVLFIYGLSQIPRGIDHLFTDNLWLLANRLVQNGQFDKYLLRPINPLFHLISERFQPDAFGEIIIGIVIFGYAYMKLGLSFARIDWLFIIIAILASTVIYTSIKLIGASIALWTKKSGNFLQIIYQLSEFASYPMTIFSGFIKFLLTFIIPFAFIAYVPSTYFVKGENVFYAIGGVVIIATLFWSFAYQIIWKNGLKAYESTGN